MTESFEPQIIAFCCNYCSYAAADLAGSMRLEYSPNVRIVKLMCTGKVDTLDYRRRCGKPTIAQAADTNAKFGAVS